MPALLVVAVAVLTAAVKILPSSALVAEINSSLRHQVEEEEALKHEALNETIDDWNNLSSEALNETIDFFAARVDEQAEEGDDEEDEDDEDEEDEEDDDGDNTSSNLLNATSEGARRVITFWRRDPPAKSGGTAQHRHQTEADEQKKSNQQLDEKDAKEKLDLAARLDQALDERLSANISLFESAEGRFPGHDWCASNSNGDYCWGLWKIVTCQQSLATSVKHCGATAPHRSVCVESGNIATCIKPKGLPPFDKAKKSALSFCSTARNGLYCSSGILVTCEQNYEYIVKNCSNIAGHECEASRVDEYVAAECVPTVKDDVDYED